MSYFTLPLLAGHGQLQLKHNKKVTVCSTRISHPNKVSDLVITKSTLVEGVVTYIVYRKVANNILRQVATVFIDMDTRMYMIKILSGNNLREYTLHLSLQIDMREAV